MSDFHARLAGMCMRISLGAFLLFAAGLAGRQSNTYRGSTPGAVSPEPLALTLQDAIQRGLKFNLGLLESGTASQTARAFGFNLFHAALIRLEITGSIAIFIQKPLSIKPLLYTSPWFHRTHGSCFLVAGRFGGL